MLTLNFEQLKMTAAALSCYGAYLELKLEQAQKLSPTACFPEHVLELHTLNEFQKDVTELLFSLAEDELNCHS